jgi:acyl dehydratase
MTAIDPNLVALRAGDALPPAERRARNPSSASENKIHDDAVAREYGFRGGLVPGATTYAYLASHLARTLGPAWAAHGTSSIALVRPVYEGDVIRIGGTVTEASGDATRGTASLECWVDGPDGTRCAPATASLAWGEPRATEPRPAFAEPRLMPRPPEERVQIRVANAPIGEPLPPVLFDTEREARHRYLDEIDEQDPLYRERSPWGAPLVHPGWYLNMANRVVSGNYIVGPWIHTRSEVRHLAPALAGGTYRAYGSFLAAFEKRGHEYATVDVLIADGADQPVARITHTAIIVVARRPAQAY